MEGCKVANDWIMESMSTIVDIDSMIISFSNFYEFQ